jgi:hypothetical protein
MTSSEGARSKARNKGEWSKIYAIAAALASGRINTRFVSTKDVDYRISGFEIHAPSAKLMLSIDGVEVTTSRHDLSSAVCRTDRSWLTEACSQLLNEIMTERPLGSFKSVTGDSILQKLGIGNEFQSNGRQDLRIIVRDLLSGSDQELSVFVKSWMGASPTLLNASNATNFRYQILTQRHNLKDLQLSNLSAAELVQLVIRHRWPVKLDTMNEKLQKNLEKIDPALPQFIASALFTSYSGIDRDVENVVRETIEKDPLNMGLSGLQDRFIEAFDLLLQEVCSGMTATKKSSRKIEQRLGVIEVDKAGVPRLIEIISNSKYESYLYSTSRFDSPSRTKFKYGYLIEVDSKVFLDLNFQIRLK